MRLFHRAAAANHPERQEENDSGVFRQPRFAVALTYKSIIADQAKRNQAVAGPETGRGAKRPVLQKSGKPVRTDHELAKLAGVSHDTISDHAMQTYAEFRL